MCKSFLVLITTLYVATCFAGVDVNQANAADLDSVKGIGPTLSSKILVERKKAPFNNWSDFMSRVKGMGPKNAVKFSSQGLTVNEAPYIEAMLPSASHPSRP